MMKKTFQTLFVLFVVFGLLTSCRTHIPYFYSAKSIEAWIVDEESKKPLEGVVVVAQWILQWHTIAGRQPVGQLKVMETVTDKKGRFYFPAWGPKMVLQGQLDNETPELIIFKSGYRYESLSNDLFEKQIGFIRSSDWNGKRISLTKFKGSLEEYADDLFTLDSMLDFALGNPTSACEWKIIPHMVVALHKQDAIFEAANVSNTLRSIDELAEISPKSCGSPQAFFRSYLTV